MPLLTFSQKLNLTPKICNGNLCFDSTQVRYIAKTMTEKPYKDSLLKAQDDKIVLLETESKIKDSVINYTEELVYLKEEELEIEKQNRKDEKELCDSEQKELTKENKKLRWISRGLAVLLGIIIVLASAG